MRETRPAHALDAVQGCVEACRRCEAAVQAVIEQDPAAFPAVGPHVRHCVDHFRVLIDGWPSGFVDYDDRPRDQCLERDPEASCHALRSIVSALATIRAADLARELMVSQSAAPGRPPLASASRLDRELVFLSGHTIHHIAIMALAARDAGVEIPGGLAVAFSTDAHRDTPATNR